MTEVQQKTNIDQRTVAAIVAAVNAYISSEELAVAAAMAVAPEKPKPAPAVNLWGLSGRQAQMQLRTAMQMRTFR